MKKFDEPPPVKLVCGLLYRNDAPVETVWERLVERFGSIDFKSAPLDFHYTDYYFREMGRPLFRLFAGFSRLIDPSLIVDIKVFTNGLEEELAVGEEGARRRVVNIDPGYLTGAAYILATSKNYAHRIYLGQGVFAQQELLFERKRVVTLDWTYPDYRSYEYQEIFRQMRTQYLERIRILQTAGQDGPESPV